MRASVRSRGALLIAVMVGLALTGCSLSKYQLGGDDEDDGGVEPDATITEDAGVPEDGGGGDAAIDAVTDGCFPTVETCNDHDDDCDGDADEGFDLDNDPAHCGGCNQACDQPNAAGTCANGDCGYTCLPGYVDTDGDTSNGCDYGCVPTNGGVEVCDFTDNDCDGEEDDGLELDHDVMNCGACGHACLALHATATCEDSVCGYDQCDPGYGDLIPEIAGCEYACPQVPAGDELCDNVDNDCDGITDELPIAGLGDDCTTPGFETEADVGDCAFGVWSCSFGSEVCAGYVGPAPEICDDRDNDCDGDADETFDKDTDPHHCGGCSPCELAHAVPGCSAGACTVLACQSGYVDENDDPTDGCEYACTPTGPEVCDGIDNDCDHDIDLADADLDAPGNFCATAGACAGAAPVCAADPCGGTIGWRCVYPDAETDGCGDLRLQELSCDDADGDCDGRVDESFASLGDDCADDGLGVCQGTGEMVCNSAGDDVECEITTPGIAAGLEVCNALDDDCDDDVDEDAPDDMVEVSVGGDTFWIYTYEASRPDAEAGVLGITDHRACSRPGVMPWRNASWTDAAAACAAAGKRLCTEAEWELSCGGIDGDRYPYGDAYQADACNGRDYDPDCNAPDDDELIETGTALGCPADPATSCVSAFGAVDMSGNLREWTSDEIAPGYYRVRGGAYDNVAQGLTCDLSFIALADDFYFPNLGFRCCSDTAP